MNTVKICNIEPKASAERLLDLFLTNRTDLKYACLLAIKMLQMNNSYCVVFLKKDIYNNWELSYNDNDSDYVVDINGNISKLMEVPHERHKINPSSS